MDYKRKIVYSYGHDNTLVIDDNLLKNHFYYTRLSLFSMSEELSLDKLKYQFRFFISDLNQMSENRIHLSSLVDKNISGYPFTLDIQYDAYINSNRGGSSNVLITDQCQLFSIAPSLSFSKFNIDLSLTLGVDYESNKGLDVFPSIIAEKDIVEGVLTVSLGIHDDKYRNTYKTLSDINTYIHANGIN